MDKNLNIFTHATKELTTDAFLVWILYFLDSQECYSEYKQLIFDEILLKKEDRGKKVHRICLIRQENRVDVLLKFHFLTEEEERVILFENKTWSSPHDDQLLKYKLKYPHCYRYLYFKLGYVNLEESKIIGDAGYNLVNANMFADVLSGMRSLHPLIDMYYEYILSSFCDPLNSLHNQLFEDNNYEVLWSADAQKYLCDQIVTRMRKDSAPCLGIRCGTSRDGRPWTQIDIALKDNGYWEELFWRIDIRSGKFYIRLNQYSDPHNEELAYKCKRRDILRETMNDYIRNSGLHAGEVTDAPKETEIVIFFLEENDLETLLNNIPAMTNKVVETFKNLP